MQSLLALIPPSEKTMFVASRQRDHAPFSGALQGSHHSSPNQGEGGPGTPTSTRPLVMTNDTCQFERPRVSRILGQT